MPPGQGPGEGFGGFGPSQTFGHPGGNSLGQDLNDLATVAKAYLSAGGITLDFGGESPIPIPFVGGPLSDIFDPFGGGNDPEIPRQMRHKRHPAYQEVIGIQVVSQSSTARLANTDSPAAIEVMTDRGANDGAALVGPVTPAYPGSIIAATFRDDLIERGLEALKEHPGAQEDFLKLAPAVNEGALNEIVKLLEARAAATAATRAAVGTFLGGMAGSLGIILAFSTETGCGPGEKCLP